MTQIITALVLLLSVMSVLLMLYKLRVMPQEAVKRQQLLPLMFSGLMAFIADAIGIGSFAVNIAICKAFKLFRDEQLPAVVNGAQIIPGAIESVFFIQHFHVDIKTLIWLILATCLGGVVGADVASRLPARLLQLIMILAFSAIVILLLGKAFALFPIGGIATALSGWKLYLGCLGLFVAGALSAFGVGLFALIEAILFVLGMSPFAAFPIMTAAGALQQPLVTITFTITNKIPLKPTLIISLAGIGGAVIGLMIISHLSISDLHWLLIAVLLFNIYGIGKTYLKR